MSSIGTGYDLSVTTYSPEGRLFQIEYAGKAVENSGTVVGIACKDGVVLGVEKLVEAKMMEEGTNERIFNIDRHVGVAVCGLKPDARQLVNKGRSEARDYHSFYGSRVPGHILAERISQHVHTSTMYSYLRPYGCSILIASYGESDSQPSLFMLEPSGTCYGYHAVAIGKGRQAAKTDLEKLNFAELTCRQAVKEIARIIYSVHDKTKDKEFELELSWVCDESKNIHQRVPKAILEEAVQFAKDILKAEDEEDDDDEKLDDVDE